MKIFKFIFYFRYLPFVISTIFQSFYNTIRVISKKHKTIYISYHWSFGHKIIMLETFVRKYFENKKLNLINITYNDRDNEYLPLIYKKYFNIIKSKSFDNILKTKIYFFLTKKILFFFSFFFKIKIITYWDIFKKEEKKNKLYNKTKFYSPYERKIIKQNQLIFFDKLSKKKLSYSLPNKVKDKVENFLLKKKLYVENKNVYTFSLRRMIFYKKNKKVISKNDDYYDILRSKFVEQKNFLKSINYLSSNKNNFLFVENLDKKLQKKIYNKFNNIFFYDVNEKLYKEISIYNYFLESVRITQNNGGMILSKLMGTKVIVTDFFPFCNGNPGGKYILIFPKIKIKKKIFRLNQYIKSDFFYGKGFDKKNISMIPNSDTQIFNVILDTKYKKSKKIYFPKDSMIKYRKPIIYF